MTDRVRYTVTLRPDFTAKRTPLTIATSLSPMFDFTTVDGETVAAFDRGPLLRARWSEPGHRDSRDMWLSYGKYTFDREVPALVERTAGGYLKLISLSETREVTKEDDHGL